MALCDSERSFSAVDSDSFRAARLYFQKCNLSKLGKKIIIIKVIHTRHGRKLRFFQELERAIPWHRPPGRCVTAGIIYGYLNIRRSQPEGLMRSQCC